MTRKITTQQSSGTWSNANTTAFRKASSAIVIESTKSRQAARDYLVKLGTHSAKGGLTKSYRD